MNAGTSGTVISASAGRFAILAALGFGDLLATVFLIIYLVSPESLGPAYNRPGADTVQDVAALFLVMWGLSAFAWAVIAREVSIRDDQVFVTRGTGRKTNSFARRHKVVSRLSLQELVRGVDVLAGPALRSEGRSSFLTRPIFLPARGFPLKGGPSAIGRITRAADRDFGTVVPSVLR